jgi:hypothetical protein
MSDGDIGSYEQRLHEWGRLPFDILESVGRLLRSADLAAARLTCSAWRTGVSFGVTHLRPRTVPNAGDPCTDVSIAQRLKQARHGAPQVPLAPVHLMLDHAAKSCAAACAAGALSAVAGAGPAQLDAFPNIQVLDLRRTSISPFQLPALQRLAGRLRALQLTYLERVGRPHEYFAQLEVTSHPAQLWEPVHAVTGTVGSFVGLRIIRAGAVHSAHLQCSRRTH